MATPVGLATSSLTRSTATPLVAQKRSRQPVQQIGRDQAGRAQLVAQGWQLYDQWAATGRLVDPNKML